MESVDMVVEGKTNVSISKTPGSEKKKKKKNSESQNSTSKTVINQICHLIVEKCLHIAAF